MSDKVIITAAVHPFLVDTLKQKGFELIEVIITLVSLHLWEIFLTISQRKLYLRYWIGKSRYL